MLPLYTVPCEKPSEGWSEKRSSWRDFEFALAFLPGLLIMLAGSLCQTVPVCTIRLSEYPLVSTLCAHLSHPRDL
jgi:hypothetical protein